MSQTASESRPSTLDGIKRLAKSIKREKRIPHHQALELAAQRAGFENIRHAQTSLAAAPLPPIATHTAFLTCYWRDRKQHKSGRETMRVGLPLALDEIVSRTSLGWVRQLSGFRRESADHLERTVDRDSQADARAELAEAASALEFMAVTGLRPATTQKQRAKMSRRFQTLPGRDHGSEWIHRATGSWVYMDEPYRDPRSAGRDAWANRSGLAMAVPTWPGLYFPGEASPHLFAEDATLLGQLAVSAAQLAGFNGTPWAGESAGYWSQFVSPARAATGSERRPRAMPAERGVVHKGALPYGASRGGEASLWRPAERMPLADHLTIGPLFGALARSGLRSAETRIIASIQSTLDDWLQMEYPGDEMSAEQFAAAYYNGNAAPMAGEAKAQLAVVVQIVAVLKQGYAPCSPRDKLLKQMNRVATILVSQQKP